jgi:hypothetical protein
MREKDETTGFIAFALDFCRDLMGGAQYFFFFVLTK